MADSPHVYVLLHTCRLQAYAAGLAEGFLTQIRIWQHYNNLQPVLFKNGSNPALVCHQTWRETHAHS
jgi:hypothetical protein